MTAKSYPGPRDFSGFFVRVSLRASREAAKGERKPLITLALNLRPQDQDLTLGR